MAKFGSHNSNKIQRFKLRRSSHLLKSSNQFHLKQVKPGFTNYQPQLKYFRALSQIEEKTTKNNKNQ